MEKWKRTAKEIVCHPRGATAMEYIMIALLVISAILGTAFVFSERLQNMMRHVVGAVHSADDVQSAEVQNARTLEKQRLAQALNSAQDNAQAIANSQTEEYFGENTEK